MSSDYSRWQQQPQIHRHSMQGSIDRMEREQDRVNAQYGLNQPQQQSDWRTETPRSSGAYHAGEVVGEMGVEGIRLVSAWAGYRAYQNHMEAGYTLQDSMWKGAVTARRWATFGILFAGWMVWFAIAFFGWYMTHRIIPNNAEFAAATANAPLDGARFTINLIIYAIVSLLVFGIQHNRIITGGLHRRTWLFKIFQVPYMLTLWCPSFFLYLILFILPITWG